MKMAKRVAECSDIGKMCRVYTEDKIYEGLLIAVDNTVRVRTGPDTEVRFAWGSNVQRIEYDPKISIR